MSLTHDDPPAIVALKARLFNVSTFLRGDISQLNFRKAVLELRSIWKDWDELHQLSAEHDPGECELPNCHICAAWWKDTVADRHYQDSKDREP